MHWSMEPVVPLSYSRSKIFYSLRESVYSWAVDSMLMMYIFGKVKSRVSIVRYDTVAIKTDLPTHRL